MPSLPSSLENLDDETKQRFRDILAVPMKFDKPEEETILTKVVEEDLTEEEVDAIACISYAYWVMKKLNEPCVTENNDMAKKMAMKVARWHMQYLGTKDGKAVTKRLKDVVQIRKERKLELLKTCFDHDCRKSSSEGLLSEDEIKLQKSIYGDMERQHQFLRGRSADGLPLLLKIPRVGPGTTDEGYVNQLLYVADRAAAISEFVTCGQQEHICAIFSMKNQDSSVTPSMSCQIGAINLVQQLYPGRMSTILMLDSPFLIRGLFNAVKPVLSASMRKSTFMLAGSSGKKKTKEIVIGNEKATENKNKYGTTCEIFNDDGKLQSPLDINKYFFETPFYCSYEYNE